MTTDAFEIPRILYIYGLISKGVW